jgi:hypothetical protein
MLRNISEATVGKTVVAVDLDVNWLLQFCDYFVVLDRGNDARVASSERNALRPLHVTQGPRVAEIAACIGKPGTSV